MIRKIQCLSLSLRSFGSAVTDARFAFPPFYRRCQTVMINTVEVGRSCYCFRPETEMLNVASALRSGFLSLGSS